LRNTSIQYGAITKNKKYGRPTVESTDVISMHRIDVLRRGPPFLFLSIHQNFFIMRNTNDDAKRVPKANPCIREAVPVIKARQKSFDLDLYLNKLSREQLIQDFKIEMNAKNKAYYFILENGHFEAFREYCHSQEREKETKQLRDLYQRFHKNYGAMNTEKRELFAKLINEHCKTDQDFDFLIEAVDAQCYFMDRQSRQDITKLFLNLREVKRLMIEHCCDSELIDLTHLICDEYFAAVLIAQKYEKCELFEALDDFKEQTKK
jgi:hypothetical protein